MNGEEKRLMIKKFLLEKARPILKNTAGKEPDLSNVILWLESLNEERNTVVIGLALGNSTGCSPFCGCAANQIAAFIEGVLKKELPWVASVIGKAAMPTQETLTEWKER